MLFLCCDLANRELAATVDRPFGRSFDRGRSPLLPGEYAARMGGVEGRPTGAATTHGTGGWTLDASFRPLDSLAYPLGLFEDCSAIGVCLPLAKEFSMNHPENPYESPVAESAPEHSPRRTPFRLYLGRSLPQVCASADSPR